jgi:hypothetical protein
MRTSALGGAGTKGRETEPMRKLVGVAALVVIVAAAAATVQLAAVMQDDEQASVQPAAARPTTPTERSKADSQRREPAPRRERLKGPAGRELIRKIDRYQKLTWHWQTVMGEPRSPSSNTARASDSRAYRLWVLELWKERAADVWQRVREPPHEQQWLCIHGHEGGWDDPGAPYYGGLQMDIGFQQTYGAYLLARKGTADNWSPLEQMWVAEKAHDTRGFTPWPNTAQYCGLI